MTLFLRYWKNYYKVQLKIVLMDQNLTLIKFGSSIGIEPMSFDSQSNALPIKLWKPFWKHCYKQSLIILC